VASRRQADTLGSGLPFAAVRNLVLPRRASDCGVARRRADSLSSRAGKQDLADRHNSALHPFKVRSMFTVVLSGEPRWIWIMAGMGTALLTAHELRRRWKPKMEILLAACQDHPTCIRLHRAFSWLARCEEDADGDLDVSLLCLWLSKHFTYWWLEQDGYGRILIDADKL
jgi:hypothetical protein